MMNMNIHRNFALASFVTLSLKVLSFCGVLLIERQRLSTKCEPYITFFGVNRIGFVSLSSYREIQGLDL